MATEASVTEWIGLLKDGDQAAAQALWDRYFDRLVRLARQKLGHSPRRAADEEDVALSAFENLCRGVRDERFPKLDDRHDLWQVLVMLTDRKAKDQMRRVLTRQRVEVGESQCDAAEAGESGSGGMERFADVEPTPDFVAEMAEQYDRLLDILGDETLRQTARWKLEGYTNEEIAGKLGCVTRTVERKLDMIRQRWRDQYAR